jgi:hypothetical protein
MVPPEVQRELLTVTAAELFVATGFDAVSGFPLPSGHLPVGCKALGMVLMRPADWDEYRQTCAFHRAMKEAA